MSPAPLLTLRLYKKAETLYSLFFLFQGGKFSCGLFNVFNAEIILNCEGYEIRQIIMGTERGNRELLRAINAVKIDRFFVELVHFHSGETKAEAEPCGQ